MSIKRDANGHTVGLHEALRKRSDWPRRCGHCGGDPEQRRHGRGVCASGPPPIAHHPGQFGG